MLNISCFIPINHLNGTQLGINFQNTAVPHIALGTFNQRKDIEIKDNIWWQGALNFSYFPINFDACSTGYLNGTGERIVEQ